MSSTRTSEQIRQDFLRFFEEKQHTIVPSAPIVPHDDPTLLFTNAGMNQFKDVFLGTGSRPYVRAADTQKCLRVSGKHNDLEEVGHDTYHHTFFEMLGNWSFGDYFKKEAIAWAWELLVDRWGLSPDRLYATVHEGDARLGLEPDEEAAGFWRSETGIPHDHIKYCSSKDNFWMMGDTGPCGPCSEVHIDLRTDEERSETPGIDLVNADDPRVMEIWNLVFIQYDARQDGSLKPLSARHIDTGMGFERVVAVLQGKSSNYDTDLFAPVLARIAELSPRKEVNGYNEIDASDPVARERIRIALRVVADHFRAAAFAVADGVMPGNVGRGYVIRRILRRAVRYGYQTLGFREPFMYQLLTPLRSKMEQTFPELKEKSEFIERVVRSEEENFLETLGTGITFFERLVPYLQRLAGAEETSGSNDELQAVLDSIRSDRQAVDLLQKAYSGLAVDQIIERFSSAAARREVPGEVAFLFHDTFGFPVDLTELMAREEGLGVDMPRYADLMQEQKTRARAAASFRIEGDESADWQVISSGDDSDFVGYDQLNVDEARIMLARPASTDEDEAPAELVLDATPFYAESGGQVGDTGILHVGDETLRVLDTQKQAGKIVHLVERMPTELEAPVRAVVDAGKRQRTAMHHTATHLLHAALRERLGKHVAQKGSLVAPDRLRFDFSHFERVGPEELREIELRVNEAIRRNIVRQEDRNVPIEEALARGAMALFGEKYGDHVRVITFGPDWSVELCGGTHVDATGEIGLFRFLSEGSVAAGVRRVEAVVGGDALELLHQELDALDRVRGHFRGLQRPVEEEISDLIAMNRQLQAEMEQLRSQRLEESLEGFLSNAIDVSGIQVITGRVEPVGMDALRNLGQALRDRLSERSVGVLGTVDPDGSKVYLVAVVTDDLLAEKRLEAGKIVGTLAKRVGGGGGGRPNIATAGGRDPSKLDETLAAAPSVIGEFA